MQSRFAARQLVFAHAAVTDVQGKRLWHDQRIAREGFDVASTATTDTRLKLRDWTLGRDRATPGAPASPRRTLTLDLAFAPTQPVLLQGRTACRARGPRQSRPATTTASRSWPRAAPSRCAASARSAGQAWLDHEWSEELLHPEAVGWDWIGMNYLDGSALTAFRLRRKDGSTLWDGGSFRTGGGMLYTAVKGRKRVQPAALLEEPAVAGQLPGGMDGTHAGRFLHRQGRDRQPGAGQPQFHRRHLLGRPERHVRQQWPQSGARLPGNDRLPPALRL
jgi:hypothetical protein